MKTITIKAWQVAQGYKVHYFSNTCQVSIGTIMTREQWETAVSHPRANMICTGLEPSETDEENLLLDDAPQLVASTETSFDSETSQTYIDAREFDSVSIELSGLNGWTDDGTLQVASAPEAGVNNLGTIGIQGNIGRAKALQIVRKNAAKALGLDVDEITRVAYRAQNLPVIKSFAKILGNAVQPF